MAAFFICDIQFPIKYTARAGSMTAPIYDRVVCVTLSFSSSARKYFEVSQPSGSDCCSGENSLVRKEKWLQYVDK